MKISQNFLHFTNLNSKSHLKCLPPRQVYYIDYPYCFKMDVNGKYHRVFFDRDTQYTNEEISSLTNLKQSLSNISNKELFGLLETVEAPYMLRILKYFNFNIQRTQAYFESEYIELIGLYIQTLVLNPNNFAHEQIAYALTSGLIYCAGRDKKFRPNVILDLNKLDSTKVNKEGVSKFVIDDNYFQAYDLFNSVVYLLTYIIKYVMYPGKIEQLNLILFLSHQNITRFNEVRTGKFTIGHNDILIFDKMIADFCSNLGRIFPFRFHRVFFITTKSANLMLNIPYLGLEKVAHYLRVPIENFMSGALNETSCILNNYVRKSQLEKKFEGKQPNLSPINSDLFPPKMYEYSGEEKDDLNSTNPILNSDEMNESQIKYVDKVNHININSHSILKQATKDKCNLVEKEAIIKEKHNFKTYDTAIKIDTAYGKSKSLAGQTIKMNKGISNFVSGNTQNFSNPSTNMQNSPANKKQKSYSKKAKPGSQEYDNYFIQSSEDSRFESNPKKESINPKESDTATSLSDIKYKSAIQGISGQKVNDIRAKAEDSKHQSVDTNKIQDNLKETEGSLPENAKENASLIAKSPNTNINCKLKSKFYVNANRTENSNENICEIREEGGMDSCCNNNSVRSCIGQAGNCILF